MVIEQPSFERAPEEDRSNVIEGTWPAQPESQESAPDSAPAERAENAIEGPWPAKEAEIPAEDSVDNAAAEQGTKLKDLRREIMEMPEEEIEAKSGNGAAAAGAEINQTNIFIGSGGGTEKQPVKFIPCRVCRGRGRRFFIFTCPACRGPGGIP